MKQRKKAWTKIIESLLLTDPDTRDSDALLYLKVMAELGYTAQISFGEQLSLVLSKELPPVEYVVRERRHFQEKSVQLRGSRWIDRQRRGLSAKQLARKGLSPAAVGSRGAA